MTNLTIGQRIDVYEVAVPCIKGSRELALLGEQYPGYINKLNGFVMIRDKVSYLPHEIDLTCVSGEVRKCGYYLKVKSLKGVSNE